MTGSGGGIERNVYCPALQSMKPRMTAATPANLPPRSKRQAFLYHRLSIKKAADDSTRPRYHAHNSHAMPLKELARYYVFGTDGEVEVASTGHHDFIEESV